MRKQWAELNKILKGGQGLFMIYLTVQLAQQACLHLASSKITEHNWLDDLCFFIQRKIARLICHSSGMSKPCMEKWANLNVNFNP